MSFFVVSNELFLSDFNYIELRILNPRLGPGLLFIRGSFGMLLEFVEAISPNDPICIEFLRGNYVLNE